jgi:hypothetical protein
MAHGQILDDLLRQVFAKVLYQAKRAIGFPTYLFLKYFILRAIVM